MIAQAKAQPASARLMVTLSVMLATIVQTLDSTIANVALPNLQGAMGATQDQVSWVLTSYIVAAAIMTPPIGFLAGRFGRKRLFLASIAGFVVVSMLCGAATSLPEIVAFRLAQGAFGAALVPLSQAVLLDAYPKEKHGPAMAMWGMGVMVGPIIGPTLGGWLTDAYSWRWVFYINLPIGILAFLGVLAFVADTKRDRGLPFDWIGFTFLSLAIGGLQMMLDRGQSRDWFSSTEIVIEAGIAALSLYMFLAHMFTARRPFLEPGMFRDRNLVVGLVFITVIGLVLLSTMALLPPFLQNLRGYSVLDSGYLLVPRGVGTMISMFVVGRLVGKVDARVLIFAGLSITAVALWQMSHFTLDVPESEILWTGVAQGFGLGFIFVPMSTLAFATIAERFRTEASSMFSLMRNIGSSIGVSVVMALLARNTQISHAALAALVTPFRDAMRFAPQAWDWSTTAGAAALNAEVTRQAAMIAYADDFRLTMWVTLAAIPLLLLLRKPKSRVAGMDALATAME